MFIIDKIYIDISMEWLNYHHLYYFWVVAREESVTRASKSLKLSQPTVSAQIKSLEEALDIQLFDRIGKKIQLSDQGKLVYKFADEIFDTGRELMQTIKGKQTSRALKLEIGLSDVIPKLIAHRLIQIALDKFENLQIHCHEGKIGHLLFELSQHNLDIVISDSKSKSFLNTQVYNYHLGDSQISFFGTPKLIKKYGKKFPDCLHEAPLLLPAKESEIRRDVEDWLKKRKIEARLVAEFDDSALLKVFGQFSNGFFYGPTVLEKEIEKQYHVKKLGRLSGIKESFFAITAERKIVHPAVAEITKEAKKTLF